MLDPGRVLMRWSLAAAFLILGAGAICGAFAVAVSKLLGSGSALTAAVGFTIGSATIWWRLRGSFSREAIVKHLNTSVPGFESSAHLLLRPVESLNTIEQIQLRKLASQAEMRLPLLRSALVLGLGVVLIGGVGFVPSGVSVTGNDMGSPPGAAVDTSGLFANIRVSPPAYTGRGAYSTSELDLEIPEGSRLAVQESNATSIILVGGDTVGIVGGRAEFTPLSSTLFYLSGSGTRSRLFRLKIIEDLPPSLVVMHLDRRTVIDLDTLSELTVEARIGDDYGVGAATIVATVTSGEGEAVRFRELEEHLSPLGQNYAVRLPLDRLELAPGDELYFHLTALDNRPGRPQRSRTETYFIAVPDTGEVLTINSDGILLNPLPQAFLSQRQLIVDTERLVARRESVTVTEFNSMSNGLAAIQSQLRLRYGQFLGEEVVEEEELVTEEAHDHDTEEGATFYIAEIKRKVRQVLRFMWESELELAQYRPSSSLPVQYRALAILQELQDMYDRVYVLRIGFEAPPVRPEESRLTGDMDEIVEPTVTGSPRWVRAQAELHRLHGALQAALTEATPLSDEAIGPGMSELSRIAASSDGDDAFGAVAEVERFRNDRSCVQCLERAIEALRRVLPTPDPMPTRAVEGGWFSNSFFELLEDG